MGKDVIIEEIVRDTFIYENCFPGVGILIGHYSEAGEYCILHIAPTLDDEDRDNQINTEGDDELTGESINSIEPSLLALHAKQVVRMLPGGIFVLGFYIIEDADNIFTPEYETKIRSLVQALNKGLNKNPYYQCAYGPNNSSDKIVIHFNPQTKKFLVKIMENDTFKMKPLQPVFTRIEWCKLESEYDTYNVMRLSRDSGLPLKKNVQIMMKSFQDSLNSATYIIAGQKPSTEIIFEEPIEKEPELENGISDFEDEDHEDLDELIGEKDDERDRSRPISPCHILIDKVPGVNLNNDYGIEELDFISHLHMQGKIAAVAFVQSGSSTHFVAQMLKQDILRSLASRLEMHCDSLMQDEDLEQTGEETEPRVYHEIPRRVFANIPGTKVLVSDYLFPGESAKDSVTAFHDILSIRLQDETDILIHKEKQFDLEEMQTNGSMEELLSKAESITKMPSTSHSTKAILWFLIGSLIIGGVSLLIPYLLDIKY